MGTKADFYIGLHRPRWIGSVHAAGEPWNIPCIILIQNNKPLYEEHVVDFITSMDGVVKSMGEEWPWQWETSQLTEYSYYFSNRHRKVLAYSREDNIVFEPLKIMQGEDLKSAKSVRSIKFPMMGVGYGPDIT